VKSLRLRERAVRLAFWPRWHDKRRVQRVISKPAPATYKSTGATSPRDLALRALGHALVRNKNWIIVPTVLAAVLSVAAVNLVTPRYKSEARIQIDGSENLLPRPNDERNEERGTPDAEVATSHVQLLLSRDHASEVIRKNKLAELPEFDPVLQGASPLKSLLAMLGIGRDPFSLTPEGRVLDAYFDRVSAYAVDKSPIIVIEFQSRDPELAARVANSIAEDFLVVPQKARAQPGESPSQWLTGIENLRNKVAEAESRTAEFRSNASFGNTTLANRQIDELNTQLNNARVLKSDAETKARPIREMLQSGKPIEASEILNSELSRRLSLQRIIQRAQLAGQSLTLLDGHPRIKELKAQLADLDRQLREEANEILHSLDNDARIAGGRIEDLNASPATVAADSAPAAMTGETPIKVAPGLTEIEQLAENLRGAGDATRKVTILGTAAGESITLTALTLARLIARHAKVVVVDLSASSPMISAISLDPSAPGLAELMLGQASFSQVITKDRLSRAHLVSAGRPGSDRALLQSPRLMLAIDALLRVYDYVLLEAGSASDLSADLLTARARAVVVPDASMADDARTVMCDQLKAVGFTEVTLLSKPSEPLSAIEPGPRVAAA
jgi:uncharacterized protein involved in exopolysaccharide biosynthesis